jgi:hypothetical protein
LDEIAISKGNGIMEYWSAGVMGYMSLTTSLTQYSTTPVLQCPGSELHKIYLIKNTIYNHIKHNNAVYKT